MSTSRHTGLDRCLCHGPGTRNQNLTPPRIYGSRAVCEATLDQWIPPGCILLAVFFAGIPKITLYEQSNIRFHVILADTVTDGGAAVQGRNSATVEESCLPGGIWQPWTSHALLPGARSQYRPASATFVGCHTGRGLPLTQCQTDTTSCGPAHTQTLSKSRRSTPCVFPPVLA
jgi:hypothetical protein